MMCSEASVGASASLTRRVIGPVQVLSVSLGRYPLLWTIVATRIWIRRHAPTAPAPILVQMVSMVAGPIIGRFPKSVI